MIWPRDHVLKLVALYEENPVLYNAKHPHYSKKNVRETCLLHIQHEMLDLRPDLTTDEIKTKLKNIRTQYSAEKKLADKWKSTAAADDIYEPKFWLYDRLQFLDSFTDGLSSLSWPRDHIVRLVELYESCPVLYNVKHPHYTKKNIRETCLLYIQNEMVRFRQDVSLEDIRSKLKSIKNQYLTERKLAEKWKEEAAPDEIYEPTYWLYNRLQFLDSFSFGCLNISWPRDHVARLAELYESCPVLYNTKHPQYNKKNMRDTCLLYIQNEMIKFRPDVTIDDIKSKIKIIRAEFITERKLAKKWMDYGATDVNYEPRYWLYNHLKFLDSYIPEKPSESNHTMPVNPEWYRTVSGPSVTKKQKTDDTPFSVEGRFGSAAAFWAKELDQLPEDTAFECHRLINDIIYKARLGGINKNTLIQQSLPSGQPLFVCTKVPISAPKVAIPKAKPKLRTKPTPAPTAIPPTDHSAATVPPLEKSVNDSTEQ